MDTTEALAPEDDAPAGSPVSRGVRHSRRRPRPSRDAEGGRAVA